MLAGLVSTLAGMAAFVVAIVNWGNADFGQLDVVGTIRLPIIGMVFVIAGLQLMMVSFTLSLEQISATASAPPPTQ